MTLRKLAVTLAFCLLAAQEARANSPMIWGAPYPLILGIGGMRFQKSDTTTLCTSGIPGSIRYNAGTFEGCNGTVWATLGGAAGGGGTATVTGGSYSAPDKISNCAVAITIGGNNMTANVVNAAGTAPNATSPCVIAFRNQTAATGLVQEVSFTAAATLVVPGTGTLGCSVSQTCKPVFYAINNAGAPVLGVANSQPFDETQLQNSTAIGTGSDSKYQMYSSASITAMPVRMLAIVSSGLNAASNWSDAVTNVSFARQAVVQSLNAVEITQGTYSSVGASYGSNMPFTTANISSGSQWNRNMIGTNYLTPVRTGLHSIFLSCSSDVFGSAYACNAAYNINETGSGGALTVINQGHGFLGLRCVPTGMDITYLNAGDKIYYKVIQLNAAGNPEGGMINCIARLSEINVY